MSPGGICFAAFRRRERFCAWIWSICMCSYVASFARWNVLRWLLPEAVVIATVEMSRHGNNIRHVRYTSRKRNQMISKSRRIKFPLRFSRSYYFVVLLENGGRFPSKVDSRQEFGESDEGSYRQRYFIAIWFVVMSLYWLTCVHLREKQRKIIGDRKRMKPRSFPISPLTREKSRREVRDSLDKFPNSVKALVLCS